MIYDCYQRKKLHERTFNAAVLNIAMVRDRLVVTTEGSVCVYNIVNGFCLEHEVKTYANPNGVSVVNSDDSIFMLATLGQTKGALRIDENKNRLTTVIQAFENSIQNISLSPTVTTPNF